ncbi:fibrinogen-related protein 3.1 [Plakobranchus ocellatus]|uniref:Fibrinogen-related protein 3.1 n=1 Tax=Plakobranchus ocellatus TaxID=259542 RepID=A0AAV3Y7Y4_9GAST|nr:fibrinogen-related protein 3.1 [Plakobranchus ocellatus]
MVRHHDKLDSEGACAEISCQYGRDGVNVTHLGMSKLKAIGQKGNTIAQLSADKTSIKSVSDDFEIQGLLSSAAGGKIEIRLLDLQDCDQGLFSCDVTFINEHGQEKNDMAVMGMGESQMSSADNDEVSCYGSDFAEKTIRLEKNFDYKIDRIEKMCLERDDHLTEKLMETESIVDRKLSSLGARLDNNYAKLQNLNDDLSDQMRQVQRNVNEEIASCGDHYESLHREITELVQDTPDEESTTVESKLSYELEVIRNLTKISIPRTCEPGMGNDVTKNYRPYVILPGEGTEGPILCDTHTDGGGWIVFQRRTNGDVDFYRGWTSYREGFGSVDGDFWMGNERIHKLTTQDAYEVRVDLRYQGKEAFAGYESFVMKSEAEGYKLRLGTYIGSAGNSIANNQAFSTFDRDNDASNENCAITFHGAWWYAACHSSNLNAQWGMGENKGPRWHPFSGVNAVTFSEMKIRRVPKAIIG